MFARHFLAWQWEGVFDDDTLPSEIFTQHLSLRLALSNDAISQLYIELMGKDKIGLRVCDNRLLHDTTIRSDREDALSSSQPAKK